MMNNSSLCCISIILIILLLNSKFSQSSNNNNNNNNNNNKNIIPGPGVIKVFFKLNGWNNANIHFKKNDETTWTKLPGKKMLDSDDPNYPSSDYKQYILEANSLEFVFNNGQGSWQHGQGGSNFKVQTPGIFLVNYDQLKTIKIYPKKCPPCSKHSYCDVKIGKCICNSHYYSPDCSKFCDPLTSVLCWKKTKCVIGTKCPTQPLPGCETFRDQSCVGDNINMPDSFSSRRWQTPVKGSRKWKPSYQDYSHIQGYLHVIYDPSHSSATVEVKTFTRNQNTSLIYNFNGQKTKSPIQKFDYTFTESLTVSIVDLNTGHVIQLDSIDFMWNTHSKINLPSNYRNGQKGALVELFGWPDKDIEKECELISKAGYLGVKIFPHQEQLMSIQPFNNELNPWYFMYQPVSYRLEGRMGTKDDLKNLIKTCRKYNVRVYADAVVNHMIGNGNDIQYHRNQNGQCIYWPGKNSSANSQSSPFFSQGFTYMYNDNTGEVPSQEFPSVPYGPLDFHCERSLSDWGSPLELNAGWLSGLTDLHTGRDHVRERIAQYFTDLIGIGFSGFRIDAMKHICPDDMSYILQKFKRNMGGKLPDDFFMWGELLIGGEHEMLLCNEQSGYNYGKYWEKKLRELGMNDNDLPKLKLWSSWYPKETYADCDQVDRRRELIQNDDHDQQQPGSSSRDMGDQGSVLVIEKNVNKHREFEKKLFNNPNNVKDNQRDWPIRNILSSYYFDDVSLRAIPDGKSDCKNCKISCETCRSVPYKPAYVKNGCAYKGSLGNYNGYTLVHRDIEIINSMRKWMGLNTITNDYLGLNGC